MHQIKTLDLNRKALKKDGYVELDEKWMPIRFVKRMFLYKFLQDNNHMITEIMTQLIVINIAPLMVLFCKCPCADL